MAGDINRVTLVGRLTRDPELRHLPSGVPVLQLGVAVNGRQRDDGDNWVDKPNFFDVKVFGNQAEMLSNHLAKGRRIGVDGRLSWREWQAQDGTKRQSVEVIAGDVFFLDSRGEGGGDQAPAGGWSQAPAPGSGGDLPVDRSDMQPAPSADDDIPF